MGSVLYVNRMPSPCGVYEFGHAVGKVVCESNVHRFTYCECNDWGTFQKAQDVVKPDVVIFNYFSGVTSWIDSHVDELKAISVGTIHEVYQNLADHMDNALFDYHIAPDPSLLLRNPIVYKTGRLIPREKRLHVHEKNTVATFGSFGFATYGKGFEYTLRRIQKEYDMARVRFNIPVHSETDPEGKLVHAVENRLRRIAKPGIQLEITHSYFPHGELLRFLASNDANIFLYAYQPRRGLSSVADLALASGRPLVLSKGGMFRHFKTCVPSVYIEDRPIRAIVEDGLEGLPKLQEEWSPENLLRDYERIVTDVLKRGKRRGTPDAVRASPHWRRTDLLLAIFKRLAVPVSVRIEEFLCRQASKRWKREVL